MYKFFFESLFSEKNSSTFHILSLEHLLLCFYKCPGACDALRDLVPFAQFKKREKYPWSSVTFI